MGMWVCPLLDESMCIINAHDFMAEHTHTLIRASMERREDERRRTERMGCLQHGSTVAFYE